MPKRKTTSEDAPVQDHKMRDEDESSSDVSFLEAVSNMRQDRMANKAASRMKT